MNYIEITRAEAHDRYDKGEKLNFYRVEKVFLITRRGVPLSEFAPNDLPTRTANVIKFSRNSYYTFNKSEEAQEFIDYILRQINENAERYGKEKTEKLIGIVNSLKIEEV